MKKLQKIPFVLLCCVALLMVSIPALADYQDPDGPYPVSVDALVGPDWNNDNINDFYTFHPRADQMTDAGHPILVFCIGTDAKPDGWVYGEFLRSYASHGIVVIAGTDADQQDGDQALAGLNWLISENENPGSIYYNKLDTENILSMGHSQGGSACIHVALKDSRVDSVLSVMPGIGTAHGGTQPDYSQVNVPIFFVSAQRDWVIWPRWVLGYYNEASSPAWYGCHKKTGHFQLNDESMQSVFRAWIYAHLYDDISAETVFYGPTWTFEDNPDWMDQRRK